MISPTVKHDLYSNETLFFSSADFYGVRAQSRGELTVFLPQASEEYGPISHYYLVVIPNSNSSEVKYPDQFVTRDLVANSKADQAAGSSSDSSEPYIAAKFLQRSIPYHFVLGNSQVSYLYRLIQRSCAKGF